MLVWLYIVQIRCFLVYDDVRRCLLPSTAAVVYVGLEARVAGGKCVPMFEGQPCAVL